ncbi:MAG: chromosome partitioning protein ParA [Leptolyngbya foveolarum]|uniref:Chromosome partitioning protein ParA n=1 Tax=Leptolyngbya foveolarum TaxID=47253 RepID=A0A2W4UTQ0_9CYAN|nr:MAG: chromosome partitioning protein ParA [Leptolyngbya foveolarum]
MIITVASNKGGVGKSTSAVHVAAFFSARGPTLLIDGDLNRSALQWAKPGKLPFEVCDIDEGVMLSRKYEHVIIDTPARPTAAELAKLAKGCDLLIVPSTPDALSIGPLLEMCKQLKGRNYKILLTLIPPKPNQSGADARKAIAKAKLPLFETGIRRLECFKKAALAGVPVADVKGDSMAGIAASCYQKVGEEILSND